MNRKIGVFDSGVGGLSVLREIRALNSGISTIYFADQIHVPYGKRSLDEIKHFSQEITKFLIKNGADLIVVACNTASAASLKYLRKQFPNYPVVGMEPALKPAAEISKTKMVGVLATPATFQGELYHSLINRYGKGLEILQNTCSGLVEQIEAGNLDGEKTRNILEAAILPMKEKNTDVIVLGCTHYPFVLPLIKKIIGDSAEVIDPAPAVAQRAVSLLREIPIRQDKIGLQDQNSRFFTSGNEINFRSQIKNLLDIEAEVEKINWQNGTIQLP